MSDKNDKVRRVVVDKEKVAGFEEEARRPLNVEWLSVPPKTDRTNTTE